MLEPKTTASHLDSTRQVLQGGVFSPRVLLNVKCFSCLATRGASVYPAADSGVVSPSRCLATAGDALDGFHVLQMK